MCALSVPRHLIISQLAFLDPCLFPVVPDLILQPLSDGNLTILAIVDCFSKLVHFIPLVNLPSYFLYGLPSNIISDCEPQFTSQVWQAFCKVLGTSSSLTTGYYPQMDRQREPTKTWKQPFGASRHIIPIPGPLFTLGWSINSLTSSATGMTPFLAIYGFQPPLLFTQEGKVAVPCVQLISPDIRRFGGLPVMPSPIPSSEVNVLTSPAISP